MKRLQYLLVMMLAVVATAAFVACGDDEDNGDTADGAADGEPTATASASESEDPSPAAPAGTIEIVSPAGGDVSGDSILVQVEVTDFTLDGTKIGTAAAEGVGHWHVYVDGAYAGLSVSDVVVLPNDAMPAIASGEHEIRVQLHNNDHTPVTPEASDAVTVNVPAALAHEQSPGDPRIAIVEPADGATTDAGTLVRVDVSGFTLDGTKIGTAAAEGVGHWHVYVDGAYAGLSVSDVIALPNDAMPSIPSGEHEITVQLHNNDHTPVTPEATDSVMVTFPEPPSGAASGGAFRY